MFDINTAIGHWPFRQVPNQSAGALRKILEKHRITGAAVAHTQALFYKNCQDANLELAEAIAAHGDFFVGVATLNPRYAAWERDLAYCHDRLKFKALRLAPPYHGYQLGDREAKAIAQAAAEMALPILIPQRVVDLRQRHLLDASRMVEFPELEALLRAVPTGKFILTESVLPIKNLVKEDGAPKYPHLYLEMSRYRSAFGQVIAALVKALGKTHVLFGTGAPFKSITPSILKLNNADCSPAVKERLAWKNAFALLDLHKSKNRIK